MADTDESIYNLIPKPKPVEQKIASSSPLMQRSKKPTNGVGSPNGPTSPAVKKKPAATMGPLKVEKKQPDQFLKKHEKDPVRKMPPRMLLHAMLSIYSHCSIRIHAYHILVPHSNISFSLYPHSTQYTELSYHLFKH